MFIISFATAIPAAAATATGGPMEVEVGDTVTLPDFSKTGYILLGFSDTPFATEPQYTIAFLMDVDNYNALFGDSDSATLYAVWGKKEYTMYFDANGGGGSAEPQRVHIGDEVYLPLGFIRADYRLAGYDTQQGAYDAAYKRASFMLDEGDILRIFENDEADAGVLYAIWQTAVETPAGGSPAAEPEPEPEESLFTVEFFDWDGRPLKTESVPMGGGATQPPPPSRDGYEFSGWDRPFGNVDSDIAVTALYTPLEPPPPPPEPPAPEPEEDVSETVITYEGTNILLEPEEVPLSYMELLREADVPILEVGDFELPVYGLPLMRVWALVNLILCAVGVFLAAIATIRLLARKRRERIDIKEAYQEPGKIRRKVYRTGWFTAAAATGLAGLIVFMITESLDLMMVLIDVWTIINAGIFIIELIALTLVFPRRRS